MKPKTFLILTLFYFQLSFAKDITSSLSYVSNNGEFKINCQQDKLCTLNINGQSIPTQFPFIGQIEDFVSSYTYKEKGIYFLQLYHGDGCPIMYRLLHLLEENKHYISEPFGNCNELLDFTMSLVNPEVIIKFPSLKEADRDAITYTYSLSHHELNQKENCD